MVEDETENSDVRKTLGPFNFLHVETLTYAVATTYRLVSPLVS